ncbi:DUF1254 domain-containing protein [Pararhizobium sp. DWP1-1-3]|uniref:DUF1254 domain-containing protein n=1 Tax=Pararhizobium sp. DWP1-1-3 TaxID=2804652 RepID=UPI003CF57F6A
MKRLIITALTFVAMVSGADAAEGVEERAIQRRGVEAIVWSLPAVNTELMYQAFVKAGGGPNQIAYWSRLPSWKNQTLTPNPDTVYFMPFFNTKEGPMVLEVPPADQGSLTGNIDNIWQVALEDAGPSGADKGKGGKYLILPPGYADGIPESYIPLRSDTYSGYALIRSTVKSASDEDVAKAVAYGKRVKLYPLSAAAKPGETKFVDVIDSVFDATIPYNTTYFEALYRVIQNEPWLPRDRAMIDSLKSLGIEKGKPFAPDEGTARALNAAATEANAWLEHQRASVFAPYFEGKQWFVPASPEGIEGQSENFARNDSYPTDARAITYSMGYVGIKRLGAGQFYMMALNDKDGKRLDGGKSYRLTVPAHAPAKQYWSATVYDGATHGFIREMGHFSRASNTPGIHANADGSFDVYFAPSAPEGKDSNWVPTKAGATFEVLFRLYGPEKPLFDKTWVLPDIQTISAQ